MLRYPVSWLILIAIGAVTYSCNKKLSAVVEYDKVKLKSFNKNDFDMALPHRNGDTVFFKRETDAHGRYLHTNAYRYLRDSLEIHFAGGSGTEKVVIKTNCGEVLNKPSREYAIPDIFIVRFSRKCFPVIVQIDEGEYKIYNNAGYSCVQFNWSRDAGHKIFYSNQQFIYI